MSTSNGQSTVLVLILVGLTGMFAAAWSALRDHQFKMARMMDQKVSSEGLVRQLALTMQDGALCNCTVVNPALTFDASTTDGTSFLTVPTIRSGCDSNSPTIVAVNQRFAGGMTVRRITFADLRPEGPPPTTSWEGEWQVHWDTDGGTQIAPTRLKQRILTAAPTGTTAIAACLPQGSSPRLIDTCPTGWVRIGPANAVGTYCIDRQERPARIQQDAIADCAAFQSSTNGTAHLCNNSEWFMACDQHLPEMLGMLNGNVEWNTEFAGAESRVVASGRSNRCDLQERRLRTDPAPYRCCYP